MKIYKIYEKILIFFQNRFFLILNSLNFLVLYFITIFLLLFYYFGINVKPKIGTAFNKDIVAAREFKYIDQKATSRKEHIIRVTTPPIYNYKKEVKDQSLQEITELFQNIKIDVDFIDNEEYYNSFSLTINEVEILKNLMDAYPEIDMQIFNVFDRRYEEGVIDSSAIDIMNFESSGLMISYSNGNEVNEIHYSPEAINEFINSTENNNEIINNIFKFLNQIEKQIVLDFITNNLQNNIVFNKELTEARLESKLKNKNVYRTVRANDIVIRKGEMITNDNIFRVEAALKVGKNNIDYIKIIGYIISISFIFLFSYFFIRLEDRSFFKNSKNFLFVSIIFILFLLNITLPLLLGYDYSSPFFGLMIPLSSFSLTFVFLFSKKIAVKLTLIITLFFLFFSEFNIMSFLFLYFSGNVSIFIVGKLKRRVDLLIDGLIIMVVNFFIALSLSFFVTLTDNLIVYYLVFSIINGIISSLLAIGLIAMGESILNSSTVFRLQELSDVSSPLLKALCDNALGTYNHSLIVSNLAEAAAREISANSLLAKVGALYHDIGKIGNAEYFIENQGEENVHNQLRPSISATVIKSHVKKGVEMAVKAKLPHEVIEIIREHHGNSLIQYFFATAKEQFDESKEEVVEEHFRYNQRNPQSIESAIVMLADQTEASSRTIDKPTQTNITKLIENVINSRFREGVLDDSGLTLKDLTKIKVVFIRQIVGMYHSRIKYKSIVDKDSKIAKQTGSKDTKGLDEKGVLDG